MARQFTEVFGGDHEPFCTFHDIFVLVEMLLTQPVNPAAHHLPSPNQLKRKILIKVFYLFDGISVLINLQFVLF